MTAADRIGVLIAGNVYVKRTLVRRFLEDDGYAVVGDVMTADAVLPAMLVGRPDAVLLDEDLTREGMSIADIREADPDVRVIVFTATASGEGAPPPGADGYLDKGIGLSALTALLGRLFAEPTTPLETLLVGVSASAEDTQEVQPAPAGRTGGSGNASQLVAMVAGVLLIAWGVFTAIDANRVGGDTRSVAQDAEPVDTGEDIIPEPAQTTALDDAYAALDRMIEALEGGNHILAAVEAQVLVDQRDQALLAGFAISSLDAEVTARLGTVVPQLPERVSLRLAEVLGSLYPVLEEPTEPGRGSEVALGTTGPIDAGGSTTGGGGTTGGGDTTGGDTDGGDTSGGGSEETAPQPGDGKVFGHSHKPPKGGWHGQKPKGGSHGQKPPKGGWHGQKPK